MARPGTARALEILHEVSIKHGIDMPSLASTMAIRTMALARREYCIRGIGEGISARTLGPIINRDPTTVLYHASVDMRERKAMWHKARRCRAS